ncbi:hypothetical protein A3749_10240, partial [Oleiphilus sp. HI0078]
MKTLDLCQFPLDSLSLIEASAGTGKTYAVANLYLRYLLEQKLGVDEILVVTFTEAATQELRDRVRARIQELSQVLNGEPSDDEVLNYLYQQSSDIEADKLRLRIAERQIDQSEIHTIHGFCQQLLARHALDLNVAFTQNLMEDTKPLLLRVCEDYWRQEVFALPQELLLEVYSNWATPAELMSSLEPLINRRPDVFTPAVLEGGLSAWEQHYHATIDWYQTLRSRTLDSIDEVQKLVAESMLKGVNHKNKWLTLIREWCEAEFTSFDFPKASKRKNLFEVFTPGYLSQDVKKGGVPPEHAYFNFVEAHLRKLPVGSREVFLVQSFQEISKRFNEEKERQQAVSFDDLILNVANALSDEDTRNILINTVRERFSVALIDEFQDTDREQYHIFSSIFSSSIESRKDASMVLIGDPKQAIYAFRGGDIATYLRAKQDIDKHPRGHQFTMDTNWRSSPEMVTAVNQVFQRESNPFIAEDIPFNAVNAAKSTPEHLRGQPAFCITQVRPEGRDIKAMTSILADHCVQQILALLTEGKAAYSDIAVLVRSGKEAELVKQRLARYGLSASYEGKSNIYDSEEAQAIYRLLAAIAEPGDEYLLMSCLSELFFCIDDERLLDIRNNDSVLEYYLELFNDLHKCWNRHGVLAAIRDAMSRLGVYASWHQDASQFQDWERRLSNVNQLAELLQSQAQVTRGHFALLRWFRQNISASVLADDESRLRLESDEQLIRIVTIHKSKGLEYPYVFLPFVFTGRGADMAWFYDQSGKLNLDLLKQESNVSLVDRERLAEDIRLLYVALTRAKYQCFLGTYFYKGAGVLSLGVAKTAWAYLLDREAILEGLDEDNYRSALEGLAAQSNGVIQFNLLDEDDLSESLKQHRFAHFKSEQGRDKGRQEAIACELLDRGLSSQWRVQSFTGLMQESHARQHITTSPGSNSRTPSKEPVAESEERELSIFDFPRGSKAGTFLHTLFESIEFETAQPLTKLRSDGQPLSLRDMIAEKLSLSRLVDEGALPFWSAYLSEWLKNILDAKLSDNFSLSQLPLSDFQAEMEFYFKVQRCQIGRINELLQSYAST